MALNVNVMLLLCWHTTRQMSTTLNQWKPINIAYWIIYQLGYEQREGEVIWGFEGTKPMYPRVHSSAGIFKFSFGQLACWFSIKWPIKGQDRVISSVPPGNYWYSTESIHQSDCVWVSRLPGPMCLTTHHSNIHIFFVNFNFRTNIF